MTPYETDGHDRNGTARATKSHTMNTTDSEKIREWTPILIGYFPKRTATPPPPSAPPHVLELCNVGFCDGLRPKGWEDAWLHNQFWVYDTEMLAWGVALQTANLRRMHDELEKTWDGVRGSVQAAMARYIDRHVPPPSARVDGPDGEPRWRLFAYRLFPMVFVSGKPEALGFAGLEVDPLPPDYERLGYDPVSAFAYPPEETGFRQPFGHSSLSPCCNGRCQDIPVNRFCLLETAEEGRRWAQDFSHGGGEPEPYVLIEVWRKQLPRLEPSGQHLGSEQ